MARGRPRKILRREQTLPARQGDGNEFRNEAPEVPPARAQVDEIAGLQEAVRLQAEQIRQQNERLNAFMERMEANMNPPLQQQQPPLPPQPARDQNEAQVGEPVYERFRKQQPPMFEGDIDPLIVKEWRCSLERIFDFMKLTDQEKVACAVYQMKNNARIWWDVVKRTVDVNTLTWMGFLELFNSKYYNANILDAKMDEFQELKQGNSTVIEYAQKFDQLSRFAPGLVATENERKRRFMKGLRSGLAKLVDAGETGPRTYAEAVERAIRQEMWENVENRQAQFSGTKESDTCFNLWSRFSKRGNFQQRGNFGSRGGQGPQWENFRN